MTTIDWAGEAFELLPDRAMIWPHASAVIVADLHLGKAASFRSLGVPVPDGGTVADLERLSRIVSSARAGWLIVLGDLLHAKSARSLETLSALAAWRARHRSLRVTLVRGNHDIKAGDVPIELGFECVSPVVSARELGVCDSDLRFGHDPAEIDEESSLGEPALFGHVHPRVSLEPAGGYGSGMRAACFWFSRSIGVLPAFGSFTGGHSIRPVRGDRVFAVGPAEVIEVTTVMADARA